LEQCAKSTMHPVAHEQQTPAAQTKRRSQLLRHILSSPNDAIIYAISEAPLWCLAQRFYQGCPPWRIDSKFQFPILSTHVRFGLAFRKSLDTLRGISFSLTSRGREHFVLPPSDARHFQTRVGYWVRSRPWLFERLGYFSTGLQSSHSLWDAIADPNGG